MGNAALLSDLRPHHEKKVIVTADNLLHPVMKEGHFKGSGFNDNGVFLKDFYHVPGLKKNFALVSQITYSGRYVLFGPHKVKVFQMCITLKLIFYLREEGNNLCMYCLLVMHILKGKVRL